MLIELYYKITLYSIMSPRGRTSKRKKKVPNRFLDTDCELMKENKTELMNDVDANEAKRNTRGNNKDKEGLRSKEVSISDVLEEEGCLDRIRSEIDKEKGCLDASEFPTIQESIGRKDIWDKKADDVLKGSCNRKVQSELTESIAKTLSHAENTVSPTDIVEVSNEVADKTSSGLVNSNNVNKNNLGKTFATAAKHDTKMPDNKRTLILLRLRMEGKL